MGLLFIIALLVGFFVGLDSMLFLVSVLLFCAAAVIDVLDRSVKAITDEIERASKRHTAIR